MANMHELLTILNIFVVCSIMIHNYIIGDMATSSLLVTKDPPQKCEYFGSIDY